MKNLAKTFINLVLILLGLLFVVWLLWARFLRQRLPKDIPFELTEFRFYFLLYLCGIFVLIIFSLLKTKKSPSLLPTKKFNDYLYTPLTKLDIYIKTNKFCLEFSIRIVEKMADRLDPFKTRAILYPMAIMGPFYLFFNILPRLLLASLLLIDIFIFKKIDLFYNFVIIGFIPLLHRYLKYSMKNVTEIYSIILERYWKNIGLLAKENFSKLREEDFEDDEAFDKALKAKFPFHMETMTIKEFLNFKNQDPAGFYYSGHPRPKDDNVTPDYTNEYYNIILNNNVYGSLIDLYKDVENLWYIKTLRILAFSLYLLAWSYILVKSFHTLEDIPMTLQIIKNFSNHIINETNIFL